MLKQLLSHVNQLLDYQVTPYAIRCHQITVEQVVTVEKSVL